MPLRFDRVLRMKISSAEELISEFSDCADHEERPQLIVEVGDGVPPPADHSQPGRRRPRRAAAIALRGR